ncbi:cation transporter [Dietzia lutea]|uniref:Cobalt transporter n=1 Tax=Dietzia lutea TaxID=546160 RepID=A0A2S1R3Y0_9ACTN|nr:cation transporter [Dietzia lutea]AWH90965.1 cobalt transporter [Dietzia lutea]
MSTHAEPPAPDAVEHMPPEQRDAFRTAIRLEWISLGVLAVIAAAVGLVAGQSQAMKAAWVEDLLSLLPPIAFLIAARVIRLRATREHPYGHHRSIGVAHLVAAVALFAMGSFLLYDSAMGLIKGDKPPIGLTVLFGVDIWAGWLMVVVMTASGIPPVILGRKKMRLAETLHDKVLFADADMNKADWMTALATVVGVLGIGIGIWWADAAAAIVVSASILSDGTKNIRAAIRGLTDVRARTFDEKKPHPLTDEAERQTRLIPWVADAVGRVRDEGHVFHAEMFVVPEDGHIPTPEDLDAIRRSITDLDWKLRDVVVIPTRTIPTGQVPPSA